MGREKKRSGLKLIDSIDKYGRHDWTRTSDLFRVKAAMITVSTTYKRVRELPSTPKHLQALRCQAILGFGVGLRCTVGSAWRSCHRQRTCMAAGIFRSETDLLYLPIADSWPKGESAVNVRLAQKIK